LLILDIALPGINGLELIYQIKTTHPDMRILVLTMLAETLYAERALRAGASGYVMKREQPKTIVFAIRQVLEGKTYLSQAISEKVSSKSLPPSGPQSSLIERLSDRELQVFRSIAQGHGMQRIAEELGLSTKPSTPTESISSKNLFWRTRRPFGNTRSGGGAAIN